ncbi:MAG: aminoacyl-tRNA hydrolase [Deltaproteobacteria bacterium]|nr:aminoacyl-tRNA hydrolase [Deltaproteobacteria bacterium]
MSTQDILEIDRGLNIPMSALSFQFANSGGPGGQHVNKSETKVILRFDLANADFLSDVVRERLLDDLSNRLNKDGVLILSCQESRSQNRNKEIVIQRFMHLLYSANQVQKERRPTRPSRRARARRVDEKKKQGQRKKERSWKWKD